MIHYTLLPPEEIKSLRSEYRTRLVVVASFFISCGIVLGILSLFPAFMFSYLQDHEVQMRAEKLRESRKVSGIEGIEKDLAQSRFLIDRILADKDKISYYESIQRIVLHRSPQVILTSLEIKRAVGTSTPYEVEIQGIAANRESILDFKKGLESDASFSRVDLPWSDLAKSRNINFTLKVELHTGTKK